MAALEPSLSDPPVYIAHLKVCIDVGAFVLYKDPNTVNISGENGEVRSESHVGRLLRRSPNEGRVQVQRYCPIQHFEINTSTLSPIDEAASGVPDVMKTCQTHEITTDFIRDVPERT